MYSVNNRLIVEAYKKEALRSTEKNGFAFVAQKLTLKGLKVLADAHLCLSSGEYRYVPKGSVVYIKEEALHTQPWAQKVFDCEDMGEPFIIVDLVNVELIK